MPMPVLATAMSRKSMSSKEPTATSRAASTTKMKLKKVKTFSRTICPTVLVGESHRVVCPAVLLPLFYLVQGEPLLRIGAEPGHLPPGLGGRDLRGRLLCVLAFHASASDFLKIRSDTSVV